MLASGAPTVSGPSWKGSRTSADKSTRAEVVARDHRHLQATDHPPTIGSLSDSLNPIIQHSPPSPPPSPPPPEEEREGSLFVDEMKEVVLHVYDVTNSDSEKTNNTILQINRIFKDRIGLGGIFHSAVQVYGEEEWSFGFCENGSGVFSCPVGKNPMYTYRECIVLGETECTVATVNRILRELSREWPGHSYDLLSRNCNHFCDVLCERLGVPKLPGWVNRFANAGDTAVVVAENTAVKFRQAKTEIVNASRVAYKFMAGLASKNQASPESPGNQNRDGPTFQGTWFKNIISAGAKPSSSESTPPQEADDGPHLPRQKSTEQSTRL